MPPTPGPASIAAMYQDALLAHHRAPRNRRTVPDATGSARRKNPVCGDDISVEMRVVNQRIADLGFGGRGCSIATASASLMTEVIAGMSTDEASQLVDQVERMIGGTAEPSFPSSLTPLLGVVPFAGRHGCALMPWQALRDIIASNA